MSDTLLLFLAGLIISLAYGHGWLTRKKEGGDVFGYHDVGDAIAPFATLGGAFLMLFSILVWIFNSNPP